MTRPRLRRICYLAFCVVVAMVWIRFGVFEAIEVPYVGF